MSKQEKIKEYESDPVTFCARCYSLKYKYEESIGMECCMECGCTDCKTTSFEEWNKLYIGRYGHEYLKIKRDPKKSPLFTMPISKLKDRVFNNSSWKEICKSLYPKFPEGLSRTDSVIMLFSQLCKDNRLDDLRMKLINNY